MFLIYPPPYMVSMLMILQVRVSGYLVRHQIHNGANQFQRKKKKLPILIFPRANLFHKNKHEISNAVNVQNLYA